eukprot:TRINITY_DN24775_c0_g1_i2.p1 TRINITY_DN24775_c0_g1~~TRINITY_DN24775_c0_g1_i2.p1  ORF type:complete len:196 (+),score=-10.00 TRINITY_DN24775_c0_g1_i2:45-632(+)
MLKVHHHIQNIYTSLQLTKQQLIVPKRKPYCSYTLQQQHIFLPIQLDVFLVQIQVHKITDKKTQEVEKIECHNQSYKMASTQKCQKGYYLSKNHSQLQIHGNQCISQPDFSSLWSSFILKQNYRLFSSTSKQVRALMYIIFPNQDTKLVQEQIFQHKMHVNTKMLYSIKFGKKHKIKGNIVTRIYYTKKCLEFTI